MVRILYMSANGFPSSRSHARGSFSLEHARALEEEGAKVIAVDMQAIGFQKEVLGDVTLLRAPCLRSILRLGDVRMLLKYFHFYLELRHLKYDCVILSFFYLKYIPFVWLLKKRNVPIVGIVHGGEVMPGSFPRKVLKRYLFEKVDLVTPVSDYTNTLLSCLISRRNEDNAKIQTIYNGIEITKLQSNTAVRPLRAQINASDEDFLVLSVSNLVKRKGIDLIICAVDELLQEGRKIKHVIVGSGPEETFLKGLAYQNGNQDNFYFMSNVEQAELSEFFASSDVFALMSRTDWNKCQTEGFGIVYAEAMAVGTPVIGGGGSGTTTPVKDGFTGVLIDPNSSEVISKVKNEIIRFMDDSEFYKSMSTNAQWYARNEFSWRRNARKTLLEISKLQN